MGNVMPVPCMCKDARVVVQAAAAAGAKKMRKKRPAATKVNVVDTPDQHRRALVKKKPPWSGCHVQELVATGEEYGMKVVMTRKEAAEFMATLEERAAAERKSRTMGKLGGGGNGVMRPCRGAWRPCLRTIPEN